MEGVLDLAVVGAGPCGLGVAVAARQAGLECVLFDKGCITGSIAAYPTYMTFFSTAEKLEVGGVPFIVAADKPTRLEALKYYRRLASHFGLRVHQYEEVLDIAGQRGAFTLRTRRREGSAASYLARQVAIATGYFGRPNLLGVPGAELDKVTYYYREGHPYYDQDCLVIGGGNSAVEAALDLYRCGARVTLLHFADRLDRGVKPWVLPDITNRLEKGEIAARWQARVQQIRPGAVILRSEIEGAEEELRNDWVFAMTGFSPDPGLLRRLGVSIDPTTGIPAHDPQTMETDVSGIFIAGVIAAGHDANKIFIENGRAHGPRIVESLC
ncbi:MAG: YpdA family putative bacillithiol disulfide reductase [Gemmatimonadetes bacterium]|nr:YpdA family putative bacillithiol disulfide reductase [Gemmatimonadota bacterium]